VLIWRWIDANVDELTLACCELCIDRNSLSVLVLVPNLLAYWDTRIILPGSSTGTDFHSMVVCRPLPVQVQVPYSVSGTSKYHVVLFFIIYI
jgi:hypothetical protein